jgi:hypothetical protein
VNRTVLYLMESTAKPECNPSDEQSAPAVHEPRFRRTAVMGFGYVVVVRLRK